MAMPKPKESFPVLTTERLCLRQFESRDKAGLHACFGDAEAMRYWNFPASKTIVETERTLKWLSKTTSPYDHFAWAIAKRSNDHCIGMVNYHHREVRNRRLEIGYIITPEYQRNGFGREAVEALVRYCTDKLGVHRIEAFIHPENIASIQLAKRTGFRCEGGPLTDYWCVGEKYLSVMVYALIDPVERGTVTSRTCTG
jgi:[ribosomal protein S5]-alanine N-acetyltransferase